MKKAVSAVLAAMLLAVPLSTAAGGLGGLVPHINTSGSQRAVNNMENRTYTFNTLPASAAEVGPSTEARQVAAYAVAALTRYGEDPATGIAMLNALKGPQPLTPYDLQFLRDRFANCPYVARSYFEGATPQNNYTPSQPYRVTVETNAYTYATQGYAKFFIRSGGADSSRPIILRQKASTGEWFLWNAKSLLNRIREAAQDNPWA